MGKLAGIVVIVVIVALSACSGADKPSASWDLAAQGVFAGAISPQAQYTLIGSLNHGASLWRNSDRERLFNWAHEAGSFTELVAAGFSPDGKRAVTTDPRTLVLWDTQTGQGLSFWATPGAVLDVAVLPNGQDILMGLTDHSAVLFDAESGRHVHTFIHDGQVGTVAASHDGAWAITGSDDNTASIWSVATGERAHELILGNPVRSVAISRNGAYAFTASQGEEVAIWSGASGKKLHVLKTGLYHGVKSATFSDDERFLAIGLVNRRVELYDVQSGRLLNTWDMRTRHPNRASGAAVLEVAFDADNRRLFALAGDGRLLELNLAS
jgi:WD40 repeat protein